MQSDTRSRWIEPAVAVTLSLAGLATSWASYQAGLWNGRQAFYYGSAGAARTRASAATLDASVARAIDAGLFSDWLNAQATGNIALARVYERRFPPVLGKSFQVWISQQPFENPAAPPSPFSSPAYQQPGTIEAGRLNEMADNEFKAGQAANRISDAFTRAAVILAMSMFFGGVGQVFRARAVRIVLILVAVLSCVIGLHQMLNLPRAVIG